MFEHIKKLCEITLSGISKKQKDITNLFPTFYDRVKAIGEKGGVRLMSLTAHEWNFRIHSGTENNKWYAGEFYIKDMSALLKKYVPNKDLWTKDGKKVDLRKVARAIFFDADVEVSCSCLVGETKIPLLDGRTLTMEEIYKEYGSDRSFWIYASDENGDFVPARAYSLGVTGNTANLVEVFLDNDRSIKCTPDHLFRMRDGSYKEAQDLKPNDSLMPLYRHHKVVRVEKLSYEKTVPVYDLTVEKYQNFLTDAGVFVHNCPAQQYWGPAYQLTKADAKYGRKEYRAPKKRNPHEFGISCKHVQALLNVLPFYITTIAKWLKEKYRDEIKDLQDNTLKQEEPEVKPESEVEDT